MGDPRQRSKKRLSSKKRLKGFTLYLCHNLDYDQLADTLRQNGIRFKRHRDHLPGHAKDTELLRLVGKHRWILLTFDQKQRTRTLEKQLIQQFKIRQFVFTSSQIGNVGELLAKASRQMRAVCSRNEGPFVYAIMQDGKLRRRNL
jgi:hypothetical protein